MDSSRAEAERWLMAAEKLLATRDFHGTRNFAIRARESDPRMEAADHILAIVDTLLASESRVNTSNGNSQLDYYAILQLGHLTQNLELIATQFRKLALLLNPERNHLPFADHAFRLVSEAWSVLSNSSKKSLYDSELKMSLLGQLGNPRRSPRTAPRSGIISFGDGETERESQQIFGNGMESPTPQTHQTRAPTQPTRTSTQSTRASTQSTRTPTQPTRTLAQGSTDSGSVGSVNSFWTACPYCYYMYEYPRVYEECALKCQNCERAFEAVSVPPPPAAEKDEYFSCWGYFPLGFGGDDSKGSDKKPKWNPLSPMVVCPTSVGARRGAPKKNMPRVYYDEDEVYIEVSDTSEDSDDDWVGNRAMRKSRRRRVGKKLANVTPVERPRRGVTKTAESGSAGDGETAAGENPVQAGAGGDKGESSKKMAGNSGRKQMGKGAKAKLDLNVEFSNEGEEPARAVRQGNGPGHGVEDTIEGTGFFEGLDEFLSSLPILSVVNEKEVKAS